MRSIHGDKDLNFDCPQCKCLIACLTFRPSVAGFGLHCGLPRRVRRGVPERVTAEGYKTRGRVGSHLPPLDTPLA